MKRKHFGSVFGSCFAALVLALTSGLVVACSGVKIPEPPQEPEKFSVAYYYNYTGAPNGGLYRTDTVVAGTAAQKPANPTREDFTFSKWTKDDAGTSDWNFSAVVTEDLQLFAQWTAKSEEQATLTGIEIAGPTKLEYNKGEELDLAGLTVKAVYSDTSKKDVEASDCEITGYNKDAAGEQTVTVEYEGKTATFTVTVKDEQVTPTPTLTGIEIAGPTKLEYNKGEELDLSGLTVKAVYSDTSKKDVEASDCEITGYNKDAAGEQTVTVEYEGKTATFTVTVKDEQVTPTPTLTGIEITTSPTKTTYTVGDSADYSGIVVTAGYDVGEPKTITDIEKLAFSGFSSAEAAAELTITVSYTENGITVSDTFTVTINARQIEYVNVTFDKNTQYEVTGMPSAKRIEKNTPLAAIATAPTVKGFTFAGWYNGDTQWNFENNVTTDTVLTAHWTAKSYNVKYIFNNHTDPATQQYTATEGVFESFTLYVPSEQHYVFDGWYKTSDFTSGVGKYEALTYADLPDAAEEIIVYGTLTPETYNITYSFGTHADYTASFKSGFEPPLSYTYGETVNLPIAENIQITKNADVITEYSFVGWLCGGNDMRVIEATDHGDKALVVNITAGQVYTVTYDQQYDGKKTPRQFAENTHATPTTPDRTGYDFGGWFKDEYCTDEYKFDNEFVTGDITIYAKWTKKSYAVTFFPRNGKDSTKVSVEFENTVSKPADPEYTGHTFGNWVTKINDETSVYDFETPVTGALDLYATWTINKYTVTYDLSGGTADGELTVTVDHGSAFAPPEPTRTGYTFGYWTVNGERFDTANNKVTENITLVAYWNANPVAVTFDSDGGSAVSGITAQFGSGLPELATPTKFGYDFVKWEDAAHKEGKKDTVVDVESLALKAVWTAKTFTVEFVTDGNAVTEAKTATFGQAIGALPTTSKTGYTFAGWYVGNVKWDASTVVATESLTLTAKWTANKYTIKYVTGDKANPIADGEYTYGVAYTLPTEIDITDSDYNFVGWFTSYENGVYSGKIDVIAVGTFGTVTVYANVTINSSVKITYNLKYDGAENYVATVEQGKPTTAYAPAREGWELDGWYTDDACNNKFDFANAINRSITLYAKWNRIYYTVTFHKSETESTESRVEYGGVITKPADPTKIGHDFGGWYASSDFSGSAYVFGGGAYANIHLYAKWDRQSYTVSFNLNSGVGTVPNQTVKYEGYAAAPAENAVTREGYTFAGWTYNGEEWSFTSDKVTQSIELRAEWQINKYTVKFSAGEDGTGSIDDLTNIEHGSKISAPANNTFKRTGYHQTGWTVGGKAWSFATDVVTGNITLVAVWEINEYTVTFDLNGGLYNDSATNPTQSVNYNQKATAITPTRVGWEFLHWTADGVNAFDFETAITAAVKLTAVWKGKDGAYLYWSSNGTDGWAATYQATAHPDGKAEWVVEGVVLTKGMQFAVVNYKTGEWTKASGTTVENYGGFDSIVKIGGVSDGFDGNNFVVTAFDSKYAGTKWALYIKKEGSGISLDIRYDTETRDPSGNNCEITAVEAPTARLYIVGSFTDGFKKFDEWSDVSAAIKVRKTGDKYTFYKVPFKPNDGFKMWITAEGDNGWYGGDFVGLGTAITLSKDNKHNVHFNNSFVAGDYTITFDIVSHELTVVAYTAPTVTELKLTAPTKNTYYADQQFDLSGIKVVAVYSDGDETELQTGDYTVSGNSTERVGNVTVTVSFGGKSATFDVTVSLIPVTFVTDGGTAVVDQSLRYGGKVTQPTDPEKNGYDFKGWLVSGAAYDFNTAVTAPVTLTAKWEIHEYTVTFKNGDDTVKTLGVNYNNAISENDVPTVSKVGHTFQYWSLSGNRYDFTKLVTADITLVAEFTINSYTVTVHKHDGSDSAVSETVINHGGKVPAQGALSRNGYTFNGWHKVVNGVMESAEYDFDTLVTGEVTVKADWQIITYTITYVVGADAEEIARGSYTVESEVTLPTPTVTTAGYHFAGWYDNQGFSGSSIAAIAKGTIGDKTFYAQFTENATVAVTFDYNYGETPETKEVGVVSGKNGSPLNPQPTRTGYTFSYWSAERNGDEYAFNTPITAPITLYAVWTVNKYTVRYNTLGGSAIKEVPNVAFGTKLTKPADPTRVGYTFVSWHLDDNECKDSTVWSFDTDVMPDRSITLYANWQQNKYTVRFMDGDTELTDLVKTDVVHGSTIAAPTAPTKTGYRFVQWKNGDAAYDFDTRVTGNLTLTAEWIEQYSVTFKNGEKVISSVTVDTGSKLTAPTTPTAAAGYSFDGWYNGESKWVFATDTVTSELVLTAKWNEIEYSITYHLDVGTNHADNKATYKVSMGTVTLKDPTPPTGKKFVAWHTAAENGEPVTQITLDNFADGNAINLYAVYADNTYTVTFVTGEGGSAVEAQTVTHGGKATKPADPTKSGYEFVKWLNGAAEYSFDATVTGDLTLTAEWKAAVKVNGIYAGDTLVKAFVVQTEGEEYAAKCFKVDGSTDKPVTMQIYVNNAAVKDNTTKVKTGTGAATGFTSNTATGVITATVSGVFTMYYKYSGSDLGLWITKDGELADYTEPSVKAGDGVYVGENKVADFVFNDNGMNQVMASGVEITAASDNSTVDVTFKYNGAAATITYLDVKTGITATKSGNTVKLYSGTYNFYYNYAGPDGTADDHEKAANRLWVEGTQTGGPSDPNAGFTYGSSTTASNAYLVGQYTAKGHATFQWDTGYLMVAHDTNHFSITRIYLQKGDVVKIRTSGTGYGYNMIRENKNGGCSDLGSPDYNIKVNNDGYYTFDFYKEYSGQPRITITYSAT